MYVRSNFVNENKIHVLIIHVIRLNFQHEEYQNVLLDNLHILLKRCTFCVCNWVKNIYKNFTYFLAINVKLSLIKFSTEHYSQS